MKQLNKKRLSLLEEVSSLYFEENCTQNEIADRLFISRTQISRLIKDAQEQGIVEIKVNHTIERSYDLESRLKAHYNLKEIYLLNNRYQYDKNVKKGIASLAVQYLKKCIKKDTMLGISWGSTISDTINALDIEQPIPISIVQIMGASAESNPNISIHELIQKLTEIYSATVYYLSAPLYIEDDYVYKTIVADPLVAKTLEMAKNSDIILTGIGTLDYVQSTNAWLGYMSNEMLEEIISLGGVGCICAHFYDIKGQALNCKWNNHCIGINLHDLKRIDDVVAVAAGKEKIDAIRGALNGGYVKILISDNETARALLS